MLHSQVKLRRLWLMLAAPQPEPKTHRGNHTLVNVNIVDEVINRNNTASGIFPSSGYTGGAADALRLTLTLPSEQIASSGESHHAVARCRTTAAGAAGSTRSGQSPTTDRTASAATRFSLARHRSRDGRGSCARPIPPPLSINISPGPTAPCAITPIRSS